MITIILIHFFAFVLLLFIVKLKTYPKEMLTDCLRTLTFLSIACFILSPLLIDINWDKLRFNATTPIKVGCGQKHFVSILVHVDLIGLHIHVNGSTPNHGCLMNEKIFFDKKYEWYRYSGRYLKDHLLQEKMSQAPKPVLEILEQFLTSNGKYRTYEVIGWYCQSSLWSSFVIFLAALVLFRNDFLLGIWFLFTAGALELLSAIIWLLGSYLTGFEIHLEEFALKPKPALGFWINVCGGIYCLLISFILLLLHQKFKTTTYMLLGIDLINYKEDNITIRTSTRKIKEEPTERINMVRYGPSPSVPLTESTEDHYEYF
ncbi:dual oxidase maturation factor 1-like [Anthonomus grandis grandis]|uniref:dual oxidase maturation factor 1-like n=1 Tax=Anthonomus grandis grandis TaxID=2921223 RepID=UPI002165F46D|nr:dual oxidase maturation factor 1-like [Anthonomus grandis grandis]